MKGINRINGLLIRPLPKYALLLLIGGLIALYGNALGHEHGDSSDSLGCPCVHVEKVEWHLPATPFSDGPETVVNNSIATDVPLAPTLSLLPVRARSPPTA